MSSDVCAVSGVVSVVYVMCRVGGGRSGELREERRMDISRGVGGGGKKEREIFFSTRREVAHSDTCACAESHD